MAELQYDPSDVIEVDEDGNEIDATQPTEPEGEQEPQERADTETETAEDTPEADTETETAEAEEEQPEDPIMRTFRESGLDKRYGTPEEALRSIPDFRRYTDSLAKANADYQKRLAEFETQQQKLQPIDPVEIREQFEDDPVEAIRRAGFASREDFAAAMQKIESMERKELIRDRAQMLEGYDGLKDVASALRTTGDFPPPGVNPLWDEMNRALEREYPGLKTASPETVLQILHPIAKLRLDARKRPAVAKVSAEEKAAANTTSGAKGAKRPAAKVNTSKMNEAEYERYLVESGQLVD